MSQEGDQAFLEGAEAALDFAFGLWSGRDQVGDAQGAESALELAFWVTAVIAGTWSKKTQAIGVNDLWDAVSFECVAEVEEVIPRGVRSDEAARYVETGMVVEGEQKGLFLRSRPPLVDGTVVLPKFANGGAAEASKDTIFFWWDRDEKWEVDFDVRLDGGAGT